VIVLSPMMTLYDVLVCVASILCPARCSSAGWTRLDLCRDNPDGDVVTLKNVYHDRVLYMNHDFADYVNPPYVTGRLSFGS
jgi:hypothetical protein